MFGVPLHNLAVHFPIVLALFAFMYDGWAVYAQKPRFHAFGSSLSKFAALGAVIALASGVSLAGMSGLGSRSTVTGHAGLGLVATIVLSAFAFVRHNAESRAGEARSVYSPMWLTIEGVVAVLVTATAVIGHRI